MSESATQPEPIHIGDYPQVLKDLIADLEHWAARNDKDARYDGIKFWALKLPAMFFSAGAGWIGHRWGSDSGMAVGVVASICVGLDGILRAGTLRSVHLKAVAEIKLCKHQAQARWKAGCLRGGDLKELAASIIEQTEKEKRRIAEYVKTAETSISHNSTGRRP